MNCLLYVSLTNPDEKIGRGKNIAMGLWAATVCADMTRQLHTLGCMLAHPRESGPGYAITTT